MILKLKSSRRSMLAIAVTAVFVLAGGIPALYADDIDYVKEAQDDCRKQQVEDLREQCKRFFDAYYATDDDRERDNIYKDIDRCTDDVSLAFANCMDDERISQVAKNKKFRAINADVFAKMEAEQKKASNAYNNTLDKCVKKKTQKAMEKCVDKAVKSFDKKVAKINKKYLKQLKKAE